MRPVIRSENSHSSYTTTEQNGPCPIYLQRKAIREHRLKPPPSVTDERRGFERIQQPSPVKGFLFFFSLFSRFYQY